MRPGNARPFLSQPLLVAFDHGNLTAIRGLVLAALVTHRKTDIIAGNGVVARLGERPESFP
jgi:hypothetical protein